MKYVMAKKEGEAIPVIFSQAFTHSSIAERLGFSSKELVSAGFISLDAAGNIICFGKSLSLHMRSRPEDSDIITRELTELK